MVSRQVLKDKPIKVISGPLIGARAQGKVKFSLDL
jgi:hypothetical protein